MRPVGKSEDVSLSPKGAPAGEMRRAPTKNLQPCLLASQVEMVLTTNKTSPYQDIFISSLSPWERWQTKSGGEGICFREERGPSHTGVKGEPHLHGGTHTRVRPYGVKILFRFSPKGAAANGERTFAARSADYCEAIITELRTEKGTL